MAHGGARSGAGRKVGQATAKTREVADRAAEAGITPLEFMLQIMRDDSAERSERLDMAKAAAPYIHPRLSSVEARVENVEPVEEVRWSIVDPEPVDP